MIKKIIRKFTPKFLLNFYHYLFSAFTNVIVGFPTEKMIVIGVTGTKGKTSTSIMLHRALTKAGLKTGLMSGVLIDDGESERINEFHMTMPGRGFIQRLLKKMKDNNCSVAIVETTSEGIVQWRHTGINYDILVFTNLTPEHLGTHGTFENYRNAKARIFKGLKSFKNKTLNGKKIEKVIISNVDDEFGKFFLDFDADKKISFGIDNGDYRATQIEQGSNSIKFSLNGKKIEVPFLGKFNILNTLPSFIISQILSLDFDKVLDGVKDTKLVGRMEEINEGQDFKVFVDYAHEPNSLGQVLNLGREITSGRVIALLGGVGGGRDRANRKEMGLLSGKLADIVVVTDVDPYKEDPMQIIEDVGKYVKDAGKKLGKDLFFELDRRDGIRKALSLAKKGDVVLITGKGAEKTIMTSVGSEPFDERKIVRDTLKAVLSI